MKNGAAEDKVERAVGKEIFMKIKAVGFDPIIQMWQLILSLDQKLEQLRRDITGTNYSIRHQRRRCENRIATARTNVENAREGLSINARKV